MSQGTCIGGHATQLECGDLDLGLAVQGQLAYTLADGVVDAAGQGRRDGVGAALLGQWGVEGDEGDGRGRTHADHAVTQQGDQQVEGLGGRAVAEQRGGGAARDGVVDQRQQGLDRQRGADRAQCIEREQLQHLRAAGQHLAQRLLGRRPADRPESGRRGGAHVVVGGLAQHLEQLRHVLRGADVGQQVDVHPRPATAGLQPPQRAIEPAGAEEHQHLVAGRARRHRLGGQPVEQALEQRIEHGRGRRAAGERGL